MNFKKLSVTLLIASVVLALFSFQLPSKLQKKMSKEIEKTFGSSEFFLKSVDISSEIKEKLPTLFTESNFLRIEEDGNIIGYAFIDKAPSKTAEFDYLILLNKDLTVAKAKVLIYREEYGGEIASRRWLKQFIGKSKSSSLVYRKDIAAISGATISVRSMTNAVSDVLKSIGILQENKIL